LNVIRTQSGTYGAQEGEVRLETKRTDDLFPQIKDHRFIISDLFRNRAGTFANVHPIGEIGVVGHFDQQGFRIERSGSRMTAIDKPTVRRSYRNNTRRRIAEGKQHGGDAIP